MAVDDDTIIMLTSTTEGASGIATMPPTLVDNGRCSYTRASTKEAFSCKPTVLVSGSIDS
jgi:hypothetical protein